MKLTSKMFLVTFQITLVLFLNINQGKANETKNLENNSEQYQSSLGTALMTSTESKNMMLLSTANQVIKERTQLKVKQLNERLEQLTVAKQATKEALKEKLRKLKSDFKKVKKGKLDKQVLIKHTKDITKTISMLKKIEKKGEDKVSKQVKKLGNLVSMLKVNINKFNKIAKKKEQITKKLSGESKSLEKGISGKSLSPVQKNQLINNIDNKTKKLKTLKEKEELVKKKVGKLNALREKYQKKMMKENSAFKTTIKFIFNRINKMLKKEKKELKKVAVNISEKKKDLKKDVKKVAPSQKPAIKPAKFVHANSKTISVDAKVHGKGPLDHTVAKTEDNKTVIRKALKEIEDKSAKKTVVAKKAKKVKKVKKDKKIQLAKKLTASIAVIKKEKPKAKPTLEEEAFAINKRISRTRRQVLHTINEAKDFVNRKGLKNKIHSLITDQTSLRFLVGESVKESAANERDINSRTIRIMKRYYNKLKMLSKQEKEVKEELELYKAAEILNLNSVKLTGLLFNLKHLNEDYKKKIKQVNDNSIFKKGENNQIIAAKKNYKTTDNDEYARKLQEIFKTRSSLLDDKKKLTTSELKRIAEEDEKELKFLESQTLLTKENFSLVEYNKLKKEKNDLADSYKKLLEELNLREIDSQTKLYYLEDQLDHTKKVMNELDNHITELNESNSAEGAFIRGLVTQIDDIKNDNKQYFSAIINNLETENKAIYKKFTEDEKLIKKINTQGMKKSNTVAKGYKDLNDKYVSMLQIKENVQRELEETKVKLSDKESKLNQIIKDKDEFTQNFLKEEDIHKSLNAKLASLAKENENLKNDVKQYEDQLNQVKTNNFKVKDKTKSNEKFYDPSKMDTQATATKGKDSSSSATKMRFKQRRPSYEFYY